MCSRLLAACALTCLASVVGAQAPAPDRAPVRADILRGEYGRYRANNDLLFYHLDIRVDPDKKLVARRSHSHAGARIQREGKHDCVSLEGEG